MTTPLSATGRLTAQYVISGKTHKWHAYCRNIQAVGGSFNINSRTLDANDLVWTAVADRLGAVLNNMLPVGATYASFLLEKFISPVWVVQDVRTVTCTPSSTVAALATQNTIVFRDTQLHKVKVVLLETIEVAPQHFVTPTGGDSAFDSFIGFFLSTASVPEDPYNWMVGRSNQYLNTQPFVGATVTLNRKMRRVRGLT